MAFYTTKILINPVFIRIFASLIIPYQEQSGNYNYTISSINLEYMREERPKAIALSIRGLCRDCDRSSGHFASVPSALFRAGCPELSIICMFIADQLRTGKCNRLYG